MISGNALDLRNGGNTTGTFTVVAGAILLLGGDYTLAPGACLGSAGTVRVSGTLFHNGALFRTPRLELTYGNAYLYNPVEVATLIIPNGGVAHFGTPTVLDTVNLVGGSSGEAVLSGTNDLTIANLVGTWASLQGSGAVNIPVGGSVSNSSSGLTLDGRILNMAGTARCASLAGANGAVVNNSGTWELRDNWAVSSLTFSNHSTGRLVKTGGGGSATFWSAPCNNSGTVELQNGTLDFRHAYQQTAGLTLLQGGNLSAPTLDIQGGVLGGMGTITGNVVNNGHLNPGASPGRLTIAGNYTQTANGALNIELAGLATGAEYDQLQVSGTASLDGALNVRFINGYEPGFNTKFQVVTYTARNETFGSFTCDPLTQPGNFINLRYLASAVELYTTDPTPQFTFINALQPSRLIQVRITGIAGQKYAIEGRLDVASAWSSLYTNVMPGSTFMDWVDLESTNYIRRFYRARFVP